MGATQTISFTQEAFDKRARQLIEAIQQNHDAYRNNIVVLANVGVGRDCSVASDLYEELWEFQGTRQTVLLAV